MISSTFSRAALALAEQAINKALDYDPATQDAIDQLDGKVIMIESTLPAFEVFVIHADRKIALHSQWETPPDTTLSGPLPALIQMATEGGGDRLSLANSGVQTRGDEDVLRQVSRLLKRMDIDWEGLLASIVGDIPAHSVGRTVRAAFAWASDSGRRLRRRTQLTMTEEWRLVPSRPEMDQWQREVTLLRQDAERLAARMEQLMKPAQDDVIVPRGDR